MNSAPAFESFSLLNMVLNSSWTSTRPAEKVSSLCFWFLGEPVEGWEVLGLAVLDLAVLGLAVPLARERNLAPEAGLRVIFGGFRRQERGLERNAEPVIFLDWSQSRAPDWIRFCIGFGAVDFKAGLEWI